MKIAHDQILERLYVSCYIVQILRINPLVKLLFLFVESTVRLMNHGHSLVDSLLGLELLMIHKEWYETLKLAVYLME